MGRPRKFNEQRALELAMERFWERGYEGTSIRELARAMEMTTASLYNAFGDKRSVYLRALDLYVEQSFESRVGRFGQKPPLEAIKSFFIEIVQRSLTDSARKGCLLVNSAMEVAPHDDGFNAIVSRVLREVEAFFLACVQAGQSDGSIDRGQSGPDFARALLGMLLGIRVLARTRPEKDLLEGLVRPVLAMLEAKPHEQSQLDPPD